MDNNNIWEQQYGTSDHERAIDMLAAGNIEKLHGKARYRFKQMNSIRFEDVPISSSTVRAQYYLERDGYKLHSKCEESYYTFTPQQNKIADFLSFSDQVRSDIHLQFDEDGKILKVLNEQELRENWEKTKDQSLAENEFMQSLTREQYDNIIKAGDAEFQDMQLFIRNLGTNLFFREILGQYLTRQPDNYMSENLKTLSNFFKDTTIEALLSYSKLKEDKDFVFIAKESTLNRDTLDELSMIRQYDELYKPKIKYNFTEYDYTYHVTIKLNKNDGLIENSSISLTEKIKNNMVCSIHFDLKRVDI